MRTFALRLRHLVLFASLFPLAAAQEARSSSLDDLDSVLAEGESAVKELSLRRDFENVEDRQKEFLEALESIRSGWERRALAPPEGFEGLHAGGVWLDEDDVGVFDHEGKLFWQESLDLLTGRLAAVRSEMARLRVEEGTAGAPPGWAAASAENPKEALGEVLAQDEYAYKNPEVGEALGAELIRRFFRSIWKQLEKINLGELERLEFTLKIILFAGLVGLVIFVGFMVRRMIDRSPA
ncbi:MAG: hypothetical protein ACRD1Z_15640, partial [Vicinamibacteria bacterium]